MQELNDQEFMFDKSEPEIGANRRRPKQYIPGEIVGIDSATGTIACHDPKNPGRIMVVRYNRHNPADVWIYAGRHNINPIEMGLGDYLHHMEDEAS